jgi:hypothetical protein
LNFYFILILNFLQDVYIMLKPLSIKCIYFPISLEDMAFMCKPSSYSTNRSQKFRRLNNLSSLAAWTLQKFLGYGFLSPWADFLYQIKIHLPAGRMDSIRAVSEMRYEIDFIEKLLKTLGSNF